jgi:peptidoglycan/LPS O-acetylase OafA/YrhL
MSQPTAPAHIPRTKYVPYLDGLRGLAILGVLADHFHVPLPPLFHVGPVGVRFFFILSGYFITLSLWKVREADSKSILSRVVLLGRFYLQRLLRVGPPFYLALALGALFGIHEVWEHFFWLALFQTNHYILYLGYWPDAISHYWSLAVQEQFYMVWPLFVLTLPRRGFLPVMLACMFFALGFRVYCIVSGVNEVTRWVTLLGCLDSFAAGAMIAYLKQAKLLEKIHGFSRAVLLAIPLAAIACYFLARLMTTMPGDSAWLGMAESFDSFFLSWLLIASLTGVKGKYARVLGWSPLVYLGRISYGVYVYHVFIIILITPFLIAQGLDIYTRSAVLLGVTLLFSALSWHYFEQPIIAWKNALGQPAPQRVPPEPVLATAPAEAKSEPAFA